MAITLVFAIEDPTYETIKNLLTQKLKLILKTTKEAYKSIEKHWRQNNVIEKTLS